MVYMKENLGSVKCSVLLIHPSTQVFGYCQWTVLSFVVYPSLLCVSDSVLSIPYRSNFYPVLLKYLLKHINSHRNPHWDKW